MEGGPWDDSRTHKQTLNHKEGKQDLATEIPQFKSAFDFGRLKTLEQAKSPGVPVPLPFALEQGTPPDESHHSPAAHRVLQSQKRMLLIQVNRDCQHRTGILPGQGIQIYKLPCNFVQLLYSLLSFLPEEEADNLIPESTIYRPASKL